LTAVIGFCSPNFELKNTNENGFKLFRYSFVKNFHILYRYMKVSIQASAKIYFFEEIYDAFYKFLHKKTNDK